MTGLAAAVVAAALVLPAPAVDQWADAYDDGNRWPGCSVTYTANTSAKSFLRAVRDVERASGVDLVPVPAGGQIEIRRFTERHPAGRLGDATVHQPPDGVFTTMTVTVWGGAMDYRPKFRRAIWRHELSHALGLGHTADPAETMSVGLWPYMTEGWKASLRALYPECSK